MDAMCLLGEVPQHAARIQNPMAALAILRVLTKMLDVKIDLLELEQLASQAKDRLKQLANEAMGEYIDLFTEPIWEQGEEEEEEDGAPGTGVRSALGGIPNSMRRSLREDWVCTAVLPAVHTREIYSATWSATTGLVASTGSDSNPGSQASPWRTLQKAANTVRAGDVVMVATTSTSFISGTGLKKCIPMNRSTRCVAVIISVITRDDVLLAKIAPGFTILSMVA